MLAPVCPTTMNLLSLNSTTHWGRNKGANKRPASEGERGPLPPRLLFLARIPKACFPLVSRREDGLHQETAFGPPRQTFTSGAGSKTVRVFVLRFSAAGHS